jgi:hypothetical protein
LECSYKTNLAESSIASSEFNARESRFCPYKKWKRYWFSRKFSKELGLLKILHDGTRLIITYDSIPSLLTVGDDLYQLNGDNQEFLGNRRLILKVG